MGQQVLVKDFQFHDILEREQSETAAAGRKDGKISRAENEGLGEDRCQWVDGDRKQGWV